jgi:hypothetical protein
MKDEDKSKEKLAEEISLLRERVALLEATKGREATECGAVLDSLTEYVCAVDQDGRIVFSNRAFTQRLGYDKAGFDGRLLADFLSSASREAFDEAIQGDTGVSHEAVVLSFKSKGAEEARIGLRFLKGPWGGSAVWFCMGQEVEEGQIGSSLQGEVRFLQTVIDAVPAPVFYKDRDLRFLGATRHLLSTMAHPGRTLSGGPCMTCSPARKARSIIARTSPFSRPETAYARNTVSVTLMAASAT